MDSSSAIQWNGRLRTRKAPPKTYWDEYVATDAWYVRELTADIPAEEWEAAVEAQLARLRSFADEVTSVHLMANTTREVTVYARRRCTDGGVGALPVEAVPAAAAAAG